MSCTWYPGKLNSLVFHGEFGILVKETLIAACESTPFSALENNIRDTGGMPKQPNSLHTQISEASLSLENSMYKQPKSKTVNNSSQTTGPDTEQCLCGDLLSVIDDMKLNYEILLSRVDALQSLANSQTACSQNNDDETVNFEIEFIEERSKNMKLESTVSLMAMKNDSEIEALKCKIRSLEIKLDKCINNVNPPIIAETPNTFQFPAYDATLQSRIVQPQSLTDRPESPIVPPHLTEVPSQPPISLSSQEKKRRCKTDLQFPE